MASFPPKKPKNHQKTTIMSNLVYFGIRQKFIFFTNTPNKIWHLSSKWKKKAINKVNFNAGKKITSFAKNQKKEPHEISINVSSITTKLVL